MLMRQNCGKLKRGQFLFIWYIIWNKSDTRKIRSFSKVFFTQRYYRVLTVLLASDFYYIFLCCSIAWKIKLSCKFPEEFCNLRWIRWTIHSTPMDVHTLNLIPGWNSSGDEIIPVNGVHVFSEMKFHSRMKSSLSKRQRWNFISAWNFKMSMFWRMYSNICFPNLTCLYIMKV